MNYENCSIHSYNPDQFAVDTEKGKKSEFDVKLESCWEDRMLNNCFRYTLKDVKTRCLPGKYQFIAQLSIKRAQERRKPQSISDIIMPFDPEKFHFGQVQQKEILFELHPEHWQYKNSIHDKNITNRNVLIINVSPLEYCNSLLVPNIEKCYPQVLNLDGLRLAIETILMSHSVALRIGMNSLGAYASVNHLHFHLYYLKETLYLEHATVRQLIGDCYELEEFPSEGFAFQLVGKEVLQTARLIMKLIEFLQSERIAHNIFMTRGNSFTGHTSKGKGVFNAVRIFVWARKSSFGSKNDFAFNPALCELAGHLLIKETNYYEKLTEEEVKNILHDVCHEVFVSIRDKVKELYS